MKCKYPLNFNKGEYFSDVNLHDCEFVEDDFGMEIIKCSNCKGTFEGSWGGDSEWRKENL